MDIIIWIVIFVVSLTLLIKASGWFTDSAEAIGIALGVPNFVIGVTIVALGTSLPELISSIVAVKAGASEIVVGNVAGSNITNIFLILGVAAILGKEIRLNYNMKVVDLPLLVGSAFLFALMIWDRHFTLVEALLSLAGLVVYLIYAAQSSGMRKQEDNKRPVIGPKPWLILAGSAALIFLGAKFTVDAIIRIADHLTIGREIIAASAVALGTSLPELMVTVSAVRKDNAGMAVGNILGSNIFNTFAVMGIPALFGKLIIPESIIVGALPVMIIATLMFYFITEEKRITIWEGCLLILFYLFFLSRLFVP